MLLRPSTNVRIDARRNRYKLAVDADEGCKSKEDNTMEIRKSRREEDLRASRPPNSTATTSFPPQQLEPTLQISDLLLYRRQPWHPSSVTIIPASTHTPSARYLSALSPCTCSRPSTIPLHIDFLCSGWVTEGGQLRVSIRNQQGVPRSPN